MKRKYQHQINPGLQDLKVFCILLLTTLKLKLFPNRKFKRKKLKRVMSQNMSPVRKAEEQTRKESGYVSCGCGLRLMTIPL